ncbi:hypothetical protein B0H16DRAFT_1726791 [Mycena metata]|uniref:Uncharacterized protein n=1 Tax=Mycena metata TaxID=1033252 RepID=A0AAD7IP18_9AGAR|nr:hypothetical protein B0H16DRAFT_1726791 [Mycena metata]
MDDAPSDMSLTPSTPNPNPAQAVTSLSAQSSNLFQNATGFNVIGGQFVSGDVHNHSVDPGPVKAQGNLQPSPGGTSLSIPSFNLLDDSFSESEIYCNQLMRRRRGFPLYVPGPPENLPEEYRRKGVAIGDVGSITPEGIFDFYFNIYLPADDPINDNDISLACLTDPGDSVSTVFGHQIDLFLLSEFGGADFVFSFDAPQGAVLALPYGARLNKLNNLELVREYVATQAQSWYEHINGARGRGLENGSLYLVTGWEKAHSWGMASFYGTTDEFQLELRESRRADSSRRYQWSGVPGCRDPSKHKSYGFSPTSSIPSNQTTFIHGLVHFTRCWDLGKAGIAPLRLIVIFIDSRFPRGWRVDWWAVATQTETTVRSKASTTTWNVLANAFIAFPSFSLGSQALEDFGFLIGRFTFPFLSDLPPIVKIFHPAEIINNYILAKAPEATVVMSHDDDWSDILAENPSTGSKVQTVSEFLDRLNNEFSIEEKDGATFLQPWPELDSSLKTFAVDFDVSDSDDDGSLLTPGESSAPALEEESDSPLFGGSALVFGAGAKQSGTVTKSDVSSHPAWAEYGYQEMSVDARSRSPGASTGVPTAHEDEQDSSAMEE